MQTRLPCTTINELDDTPPDTESGRRLARR
jgi:hypothetical protein